MSCSNRVFKFPSAKGRSTVTLTETDHGWELESTAKRVYEVYMHANEIKQCGGILAFLKRQQTFAGFHGGPGASIYAYYVDAIESHKKGAVS